MNPKILVPKTGDTLLKRACMARNICTLRKYNHQLKSGTWAYFRPHARRAVSRGEWGEAEALVLRQRLREMWTPTRIETRCGNAIYGFPPECRIH